ncbi:MAG: hypothetical protein AAB676_17980 [Verrucomicrobiota bacterium]
MNFAVHKAEYFKLDTNLPFQHEFENNDAKDKIGDHTEMAANLYEIVPDNE